MQTWFRCNQQVNDIFPNTDYEFFCLRYPIADNDSLASVIWHITEIGIHTTLSALSIENIDAKKDGHAVSVRGHLADNQPQTNLTIQTLSIVIKWRAMSVKTLSTLRKAKKTKQLHLKTYVKTINGPGEKYEKNTTSRQLKAKQKDQNRLPE